MDKQGFFDRHADTWDTNHWSPAQEAALARVVELSQVGPGDRVLDVGTGTGVLLPHLLRVVGPAGSILAIDLSAGMLEVAGQKGFPANVELRQADVHAIPAPSAGFDRVICNAAFPHFTDRAQALREMVRVLRPGGLLVISHPTGRAAVNARHRRAGGPVEEDRVPTPSALTSLLVGTGLTEVLVVDEPQFYLARALKP